jgi:hypothetical protein
VHPRFARTTTLLAALAALQGLAACDAASAVGADPTANPFTLGMSDLALVAGDTLRIPATGAAGDAVVWSSTNPAVATVDALGLVRAVGEGDAQVVAARGSVRALASVRVTRNSYRIAVTPDTLTLDAGQGASLTIVVTDHKGRVVAGARPLWSSSAPSVAQVDSMGRVTATAAGTALIAAALGGHADTTRVTVRQPAAAPVPAPPSSPTGFAGPAELPRVYLDSRFPAITGRTINVAAGASLQAALNDAQPGDQIVLQAGASFTGNFVLPKKSGTGWIVVRTSGTLPAEGTRARPSNAGQMARVLSPNADPAIRTAPGADRWRLVGLEVAYAPGVTQGYSLVGLGDGDSRAQDLMEEVPTNLVLDRMYIHGSPTVGLRRCVALNSASTSIVDSWISECHIQGFDSQAIGGWNGPGPFRIVNNFIEGAGENVMFGGADAATGMTPSDIEIRRNHFFKPLAWKGVWSVKNSFEIKSGVRVLVEGNVFENNWFDAQSGFAWVLKGDPGANARTSDITMRYNRVVNTLSIGTLADAPNGGSPMVRVYIGHNIFERTGEASTSAAAGRAWQLLGALTDLTLENNTSEGGMYNTLVLEGTGKTRFFVRNNVTDRAVYPPNVHALNENGIAMSAVSGNVFAGAIAASSQITGNSYPAGINGYSGPAGADRARVDAATAGVVVQP